MAAFKEPKKFGVIPGNAADVTAIQDAASVLNPSMTDLFPAIYQLALAAGGKAPERTTFNQFLKLYGEKLYFIERGGMWSYDATADYPAGALVGYSGALYLALKDNGSSTDAGAVQPDADGEVWQKLETAADLAKALLGYLPVATAESVYLKKNDASDTYLSKEDAEADYLSKSDAEADYLSKSGAAADYLKQTDASDTYLSKEDASDTYLPKEDLSAQIITSVRSNWYTAYPDGAEAHNAMWGGRDITAAFDAGTVSEHIADGTFKDIFPGDYITKAITVSGTAYTVKWIIMELDYWLNTLGNTPVTAHHAVILPETPPFNAYMNSTNTTSGGYTQCAMYKNTIPAFAAGLTAAFGAGHILTFQEWFSTHTNDTVQSTAYGGWQGASTGWDGTEKSLSFTCNLMNSMMAFGAPIWSSSGFDSFSAVHQFAAFRMNPTLIYANRSSYWLRDVVSSAFFAGVYGGGSAGADFASRVYGVRPFALLH